MFKAGSKLHFIKNLYLRWRYGAGCCDTYTLDVYLAPRLAKVLKRFRLQNNKCPSYPSHLASIGEWHTILDEMVWAFEHYAKDNQWSASDEDNQRARKGVKLFGEYFDNLWN